MKSIKLKKPPFLTPKAVKYWNTLTRLLQDLDGFHELDIFQLAILCNSLQDYQEATRVLEREGRYYVSPGGMRRLHPMTQVQAEALKTIKELGAGFGLNFRSRNALLKIFQAEREPF